MKKTSILFVCHGSICRSPMAEFVFLQMVKEAGLDGVYSASSAAVSAEELGNDLYPPAKRVLRANGIPFSTHRAHVVTETEMAEAKLVLVMDRSNRRWLERLFNGRYAEKIRLLMEFAGECRDVADPWYTDDFDETFRDITAGCRGLLSELVGRERNADR